MSTDTTDRPQTGERPTAAAEPARAAYRLFHVRVARTRSLGPSTLRITFTSPELAAFGAGGFDQRVKLLLPVLPLERYRLPDEDWYGWWKGLPEDVRPVMRTYTVRAARPAAREVDVDVVLHGVADGHAGPASTWAATATAGDAALLVAPGTPGTGRMWGVEWAPPAQARTFLLAGDETAVPAVLSVLSQLPAGARATALLEIPEDGDVQDVETAADVSVQWLPRNGCQHGALLSERVPQVVAQLVRQVGPGSGPGGAGLAAVDLEDVDVDHGILWEVPEAAVPTGPSALYAWLAGEAGVVKDLRRHLVREVGVPGGSVAFMGYWRRGRAEDG